MAVAVHADTRHCGSVVVGGFQLAGDGIGVEGRNDLAAGPSRSSASITRSYSTSAGRSSGRKSAAVLVGDAQGVGETFGDDRRWARPCLEQALVATVVPSRTEPTARREPVVRPEAEQLADTRHRGVPVARGYRQELVRDQASSGRRRRYR